MLAKLRVDPADAPEFPAKTLRSMSSQIIYHRKVRLESWLKCIVRHKLAFETLSAFLQTKDYDEQVDLTPDELIVRDFSESLFLNPHRKLAFLDKFMKEFFIRRRVISYDIAEDLFEILIPLCSEPSCIGKPLDIICKLLDRDFYRFFDFMQKVFDALPACLLIKMNLKDYLKQKICPDSQAKAFGIIKILEANEVKVDQLLEFDKQALEIYRNWGVCAEQKSVRKESASQVVMLVNSKDLQIGFRTSEKIIEVSGTFEVNSSPSKLVDLITTPFDRVEWDTKLSHMYEDAPFYKLFYTIDNKTQEFDTSIEVSESLTTTEIKVSGKMVNCEYSEFNTVFRIERVSSNDSEIEGKTGKLRCSWESDYKGKAGRLVMFDLIGEDTTLINSFKLLMEFSQSRNLSYCSRNKKLSIHEAVERKKLILYTSK